MQSLMRTLSWAFIVAFTCLPFTSYAQDSYRFTVQNHFNKKLNFIVGINPQVLPDFPANLQTGSEAQATILVPIEGPKEAYIRVEVDDTKSQNAFWGVDVIDGKVRFHGYIGKGIAYSWKKGGDTITFCTPEEYKTKHAC